MSTTKNQPTEPVKTPALDNVNDQVVNEKESSVSFRCTESQKSLLIKKAVVESGLTLSEFIKYKLFNEVNPDVKKAMEAEIDVLQDEERNAYEELVKKLRGQILDLNNTVFELKAQSVILKDDPAPANLHKNHFSMEFFENVKNQLVEKKDIDFETFIDKCIEYARKVNNENTGFLSSVPEISKFIEGIK